MLLFFILFYFQLSLILSSTYRLSLVYAFCFLFFTIILDSFCLFRIAISYWVSLLFFALPSSSSSSSSSFLSPSSSLCYFLLWSICGRWERRIGKWCSFYFVSVITSITFTLHCIKQKGFIPYRTWDPDLRSTLNSLTGSCCLSSSSPATLDRRRWVKNKKKLRYSVIDCTNYG